MQSRAETRKYPYPVVGNPAAFLPSFEIKTSRHCYLSICKHFLFYESFYLVPNYGL